MLPRARGAGSRVETIRRCGKQSRPLRQPPGIVLRQGRIIVPGDGALQHVAEGRGREQFHLRHGLGSGSAGGGQGIARYQISRVRGFPEDEIADRLGANIASRPITHPIRGLERGARLRHPAQIAVAKAQMGVTIVVHLHHEVRIVRTAFQQIAFGMPGFEQRR